MDKSRTFYKEFIKRKLNIKTISNALMLCLNLCCHASVDRDRSSDISVKVVCKSNAFVNTDKDEVVRTRLNSAKQYVLNYASKCIFIIYNTFYRLLNISTNLKNVVLIENKFKSETSNLRLAKFSFNSSIKLLH